MERQQSFPSSFLVDSEWTMFIIYFDGWYSLHSFDTDRWFWTYYGPLGDAFFGFSNLRTYFSGQLHLIFFRIFCIPCFVFSNFFLRKLWQISGLDNDNLHHLEFVFSTSCCARLETLIIIIWDSERVNWTDFWFHSHWLSIYSRWCFMLDSCHFP